MCVMTSQAAFQHAKESVNRALRKKSCTELHKLCRCCSPFTVEHPGLGRGVSSHPNPPAP